MQFLFGYELFPYRDYDILPNKELHRSIQVGYAVLSLFAIAKSRSCAFNPPVDGAEDHNSEGVWRGRGTFFYESVHLNWKQIPCMTVGIVRKDFLMILGCPTARIHELVARG